jgi:hypothetical protein
MTVIRFPARPRPMPEGDNRVITGTKHIMAGDICWFEGRSWSPKKTLVVKAGTTVDEMVRMLDEATHK